MNKLTKLLSVFIIAGAVGASVAGVSACKKKGHTHSVDLTKSVDNGDGTHDVYCGCGHLMFDDDPHSWDDNGICTKCGNDKNAHSHHYSWHDNGDGTHNGTCSNEDSKCDQITITNEVHELGPDGHCLKCNGTAVEPDVTGVSISAAGDVDSVKLNGTLQFSATVEVVGGAPTTVTWSVVNGTGSATISTSGLLTATGVGEVTVKAASTEKPGVYDEYSLTIEDLTTLEKLMARTDKLAVLDENYTVGNNLTERPNYTDKGIYASWQAAGHDAAVEYVKVIDENGVKALEQHGSGGTTGKPNVYTDIVIGPSNGVIEGYFETKVVAEKFGSAQDLVNFMGGETALFKITIAGGVLKYKVGTATADSNCDATVNVTVNTYISVYFKIDKAQNNVTVSVNDTVILNGKNIDVNRLNCIQLPSTNKGGRLHTTKNIVVCGTAVTLDESKTEAKRNLQNAYEEYNLADYTSNATHLTKAYTDGVAAIEAAANLAGVSKAYADSIAAMAAILKETDIPAARAAARTALETKFPYRNYSYALDQSLPNSVYNNKAKHEEEMQVYIDRILAATLKSVMDEIVEGANITVGNDAAQLAAMKTATLNTLKEYITSSAVQTDYAALTDDDKARIDAIVKVDGTTGTLSGSGVTAINEATAIQSAQAAYDEAKADIDRIISNSKLDNIEAIIAKYEADLDNYTPSRPYNDTDKINLEGTDTVVALFNAAKAAGKTEIAKAKDINTVDGIDSPTAEQILQAQRNFALAEFDKATAAINLIACKNFRLNNVNDQEVDGLGVRKYVENAKAQVTDSEMLTMFDALSEAEIIAATTIDDVVAKTQAYKFQVDLILAKNEACFGEGEEDKESTYGLEKYFNLKFAASGLREADKEALYNKVRGGAEVQAIIDAQLVADITSALANAKVAVDNEIAALKNAVFTITVKFNGYGDDTTKTVHMSYGGTVSKESIYITGMTVTKLYDEGGVEITEGVQIYANTTVKVDVSDNNAAAASTSYTPVGGDNVTPVTDKKVLDDTLLSVTVPDGSALYKSGNTWKDSNNADKSFNKVTVNGTDYSNALSLGNITSKTDNKAKPLTIQAKSALSELKVYVKLAGSNGTDSRSGNLCYTINGGEPVKSNKIDNELTISGIMGGDVVQIYIENTGSSGGHMWIAKVEANADTSKTPKLVTVNWTNQDGSVWKTTTHSYLDVITAPEGLPTVEGAFTGWKYDNTPLTETTKFASSATAYVMTPVVETPDVTVHYVDGAKTTDEEYLSTVKTYTLPEAEDATETNMFLGWYVRKGAEPADTDELFDIKNLTAGEITVYAKYLASSITVKYGDAEPENLFILDGNVVKVDKTAAALPADPESTDPENPEFKGWYYTPEGGEETQFTAEVLASLTAGDYTVTAKFGAMTAVTYSVDDGTLGTASNDVFTLNGSFNSGSAGWKDAEGNTVYTKAIRAGGNNRSIAFTVKAGTKITIACGGSYGTNGASGDIWLGTATNTAAANALAKVTATNEAGKKTSSSLLEYTFTEGGTYYIIFDSNKPSIYAITLS